MRRHVVDASVVIKWFVEEVQADHARELQDDQFELFAPTCSGRKAATFCGRKCSAGN